MGEVMREKAQRLRIVSRASAAVLEMGHKTGDLQIRIKQPAPTVPVDRVDVGIDLRKAGSGALSPCPMACPGSSPRCPVRR